MKNKIGEISYDSTKKTKIKKKKKDNNPNCPQVRPIENVYALCKANYKSLNTVCSMYFRLHTEVERDICPGSW